MKFTLCFIFTMLLVAFCSAQGKFLGVHYGVSNNNVLGQLAVKTHNLRGDQWAFQYEYRSETKLGYALGLTYGTKGFSTKVVFTDEDGTPTGEELGLENEFTYVSAPIKTGFFFGKKFSGFGYAGVAPSFLINAFQDTYQPNGLTSVDVSDKPEKFDLQLLLEVGAHYQVLKRVGLMASVQFDQSILKFTKREFFEKWQMRHSGALLRFGITYRTKGAKAKKPFVVY